MKSVDCPLPLQTPHASTAPLQHAPDLSSMALVPVQHSPCSLTTPAPRMSPEYVDTVWAAFRFKAKSVPDTDRCAKSLMRSTSIQNQSFAQPPGKLLQHLRL